MATTEIITYISIIVPAIPLLLGYKKRTSLLWFYIMAGFISDILLVLVFSGKPIRALIANLFIITEFIIISAYYYKQLDKRYNWLLIVAIIISIPAIANMFYIPGTGFSLNRASIMFNWLGASALCVVYIGYALCGFLQIIRRQTIVHLERSSFFLVNTAFITYYSTVFLVLLFSQYLIDVNKITLFWNFLEFMNILKYLVLARVLTLKDS